MDKIVPVQNVVIGDYTVISTQNYIVGLNENIEWDLYDSTPEVLHIIFQFEKDENNPKAYTKCKGEENNVLRIIAYNIPSTGTSMIQKIAIGTYDHKNMFMSYHIASNEASDARLIAINIFVKNEKNNG